MTLIADTIQKERLRVEYMIQHYELQLRDLPKGTISEHRSGKNTYFYLKYREGNKVVSKYIESDQLDDLQSQISERQHITQMIKLLKKELKFANKALEIKI